MVPVSSPTFLTLILLVSFRGPGSGSLGPDGPLPPLPADTLPAILDPSVDPLGLGPLPAAPRESPLTAERIALGRRLFFDPILSRDGTVSCASCHRPDHGFASPDPVAIGIEGRTGTRNAPTVLNRGHGAIFFWDGRAATLEAQVLEPIENPVEFDHSVDAVLRDLAADPEWVRAFEGAFGSEAPAVTRDHLAAALASFLRALRAGNSPVDRFQAGEYAALSDEARQGLWIFESSGGCWKCHSGPNLTDETFHNTGVAHAQETPDPGRFAVTGDAEDRNRFKTPTLRELENTAPYMHDGSLATLRDVVLFYDRGGNREAPGLSPLLEPLDLSEAEIGFLVAFLEALTEE